VEPGEGGRVRGRGDHVERQPDLLEDIALFGVAVGNHVFPVHQEFNMVEFGSSAFAGRHQIDVHLGGFGWERHSDLLRLPLPAAFEFERCARTDRLEVAAERRDPRRRSPFSPRRDPESSGPRFGELDGLPPADVTLRFPCGFDRAQPAAAVGTAFPVPEGRPFGVPAQRTPVGGGGFVEIFRHQRTVYGVKPNREFAQFEFAFPGAVVAFGERDPFLTGFDCRALGSGYELPAQFPGGVAEFQPVERNIGGAFALNQGGGHPVAFQRQVDSPVVGLAAEGIGVAADFVEQPVSGVVGGDFELQADERHRFDRNGAARTVGGPHLRVHPPALVGVEGVGVENPPVDRPVRQLRQRVGEFGPVAVGEDHIEPVLRRRSRGEEFEEDALRFRVDRPRLFQPRLPDQRLVRLGPLHIEQPVRTECAGDRGGGLHRPVVGPGEVGDLTDKLRRSGAATGCRQEQCEPESFLPHLVFLSLCDSVSAAAERQVRHADIRIESLGEITEIHSSGIGVSVVEENVSLAHMVESETVTAGAAVLVVVLEGVVGGDELRGAYVRILVGAVRIGGDDGEVPAVIFPIGVVVRAALFEAALAVGAFPGVGHVGIGGRTDADVRFFQNPLRQVSEIRHARNPIGVRASVGIVHREPGTVEPAAVIRGILGVGKADLLELGDAGRLLRPFPCLVQRRQQHRRENGDDGDHDQQFDQGESGSFHFSLSFHIDGTSAGI